MTRLPNGLTRAAIVRAVAGTRGDLVVTLTDHYVLIRPKGRRQGAVTVSWQGIYERALLGERALLDRVGNLRRRTPLRRRVAR